MLDPRVKTAGYWKNSSDNGIIRMFIDFVGEAITKKLEILLLGGYVIEKVEEDLTYNDLLPAKENLWSILYLTGYVTRVREEQMKHPLPKGCLGLCIPNREIKEIFETTISKWFQKSTQKWNRNELFRAVWNGDAEVITKDAVTLLYRIIWEIVWRYLK